MAQHDPREAAAPQRKATGRRTAYRLAAARLARLRQRREQHRIAFVDHARGIALLLVVVMQGVAASGPEPVQSLAHGLASFAEPFAVPSFLLVMGIFARQSLAAPWPAFIDRRIIPYAAVYIAWAATLMVASSVAAAHMPGLSFGEIVQGLATPFAALQLLWLVPLCLVALKLVTRVAPVLVGVAAIAAAILQTLAGPSLLAACMGGFAYFYVGAMAGPRLLALARRYQAQPELLLGALALWGGLEGFLVFGHTDFAGTPIPDLPGVGLALGFAGSAAVLIAAVLTPRVAELDLLRLAGRYWVVTYLGLLPCFALIGLPILHAFELFGSVPPPYVVGVLVTLLVLLCGSFAERFYATRRHVAAETRPPAGKAAPEAGAEGA